MRDFTDHATAKGPPHRGQYLAFQAFQAAAERRVEGAPGASLHCPEASYLTVQLWFWKESGMVMTMKLPDCSFRPASASLPSFPVVM